MKSLTTGSVLTGLLVALAAAGCTTDLKVVRAVQGKELPTAGAPYNLSFTQYAIKVTRRVVACEIVDGKKTVPRLVIATTADVARSEKRDPQRDYVIDFESLQAAWKTSSLEVEYHDNGTLKSINAAAEDRTGPILASVASSLGKLVVAAAASGGASDACKEDTIETLKDIAIVRARLEKKSEALERKSSELEFMTKSANAAGPAWGRDARERFAEQLESVNQASNDLTVEQDKLAELLSGISNVYEFTWPKDGITFESDPDIQLVPDIPLDDIRRWAAPKDAAKVQSDTRIVSARIEATTALGAADACNGKCAEDDVPGLKYRMPAPGRLLLCSARTCDKGKDEIAVAHSDLISQLGRVYSLPLRSSVFSKKSIAATFDEAGRPIKLGVKSETAAAETAATGFGAFADAFVSARKAVVPSKLDRIKAETELLKAQGDLAAAKKALQAPANESSATATAALTADTALLQARLANLQARAALEAAEKAGSN